MARTRRRGRQGRPQMRRGGRPRRKMHMGGFTAHGISTGSYPNYHEAYGRMDNANMNESNKNYVFDHIAHEYVSSSFSHASDLSGPHAYSSPPGDMDGNQNVDIVDLVQLVQVILNDTRGGGGQRQQLMNIQRQLQSNPTPQVVNRARQMVGRMRKGGKTSYKLRQGGKTRRNKMRRGGRTVARRKMRTGGRPTRKMPHGGRHNGNGCPTGMMMSNGQCVPSTNMGGMSGYGAYRRGGRPGRRKMQAGGGVSFCPNGNYGRDAHGNTYCL